MADWLLGRAPVPKRALLRAARMEAYAYAVLDADDPARESLLPAYLETLTRHYRIRDALLPLVRAWWAAGIEVLLFKGFYLSEFVYPAPGARFHGDVDLLIRPQDLATAARVAVALGWTANRALETIGEHDPEHCPVALTSPDGIALVDVHQFPVHRATRLRWSPVHVTRAVWQRSRRRIWEGIPIREMDPVDNALVGVVLQRCWGTDHWVPKPADYVDLSLLLAGMEDGRRALLARAKELRCRRTLLLYEKRCAPWAGVLDLRPVALASRYRLDCRIARERVPRAIEMVPNRVAKVLPIMRELDRTFRVRREAQRHQDLRGLLRVLAAPGPTRPPLYARDRATLVRAALWAQRLCRGTRLDVALCVYHALRQHGHPAVFVRGVPVRGGDDAEAHAWIELNGAVLPELDDADVRERYRVDFVHAEP